MTQKIEDLIKRYRFFGWPLLSILISLFLLFFVVIPQVVSYLNTNKLIDETNQKVQSLNAKAQILAGIPASDYRSNLNLALVVLPENRDVPTAIGQIQSIVSQSGMQLSSIGVSGSDSGASGGSAQSYSIKIDVIGTTDALQQLFSGLELGPEIMKLNGLEVSLSGKGLVDANLNILTYYQGPPAVLGDVEKPVEGLTSQEMDLLAKIQKQIPSTTITSNSTVLPPRGKSNPFQ